jgi:MoxR-like ATPase
MNEPIQSVLDGLDAIILGKQREVRLALASLLAGGHLLIEDVPGTGKTTLALALGRVLGLQHRRVQFTVDVLPSDITGSSIYRQSEQTFEFHPGPVFSQILLADEINRAMPKTQSALLEAMEENAVSQDGVTYPLPSPFFVIATQNPAHHSGTYPLPESQLDRFLMTLQMGYPSADAELVLLTSEPTRQKVLDQSALSTPEQLLGWQADVRGVKVASAIADYVLRLVRRSREDASFEMGLSPRGGLSLVAASRSWAFLQGRDFVTPEDVQAVFAAVCQHRLRFRSSEDRAGSLHSLTEFLNHVDVVA